MINELRGPKLNKHEKTSWPERGTAKRDYKFFNQLLPGLIRSCQVPASRNFALLFAALKRLRG